jgi:hypothetical protein
MPSTAFIVDQRARMAQTVDGTRCSGTYGPLLEISNCAVVVFACPRRSSRALVLVADGGVDEPGDHPLE